MDVKENSEKSSNAPETENAPLILTLQLDEKSFRFFTTLRQQHFPPERNYLQAHLTLFHHLPHTNEVAAAIKNAAAQTPKMDLAVTGVVCTGRGVAYKIENKALIALHKQLQQQWRSVLTPQDAQGLWPHITVQNKVDAATAKALQTQLSASFEPFTAVGTGLSLFIYKGGPWQHVAHFSFNS